MHLIKISTTDPNLRMSCILHKAQSILLMAYYLGSVTKLLAFYKYCTFNTKSKSTTGAQKTLLGRVLIKKITFLSSKSIKSLENGGNVIFY